MPPKSKRSKSRSDGAGSSRTNPPQQRRRTRESTPEGFDSLPTDFNKTKVVFPGKRLVRAHVAESYALTLLDNQGCGQFLEFQHDVYAVEVYLFYKSLRQSSNGNLYAKIHGRELELTPDYIANAFGLVNGFYSEWFDPQTWPRKYDMRELSRALTQGRSNGAVATDSLPPVARFGPHTYILYCFIGKNLLARDRQDGRIDHITGFVMWQTVIGHRLNWPFYILRHMYECRNHKRLPYGQHLSFIFDREGIPHYDGYTLSSLGKNWYLTLSDLWQAKIYLYNGEFVDIMVYARKSEEEQAAIMKAMRTQNKLRHPRDINVDEDDETDEDPTHQEVEPPAVPAFEPEPTTRDIMNLMHTQHEEMLASMNTWMATMDARYVSLENYVHNEMVTMRSNADYLVNKFDAWDVSRGGASGSGGGGSSMGP